MIGSARRSTAAVRSVNPADAGEVTRGAGEVMLSGRARR